MPLGDRVPGVAAEVRLVGVVAVVALAGLGACGGDRPVQGPSAAATADGQAHAEADLTSDAVAETAQAADTGPTCVGRCGLYDANAACQCDPACQGYGDCCGDFTFACPDLVRTAGKPGSPPVPDPASCKGRCGAFVAQAACQCDADCLGKGDCCADFDCVCLDHAPNCNGLCKVGQVCNPEAPPCGQCVTPTCKPPKGFAGPCQRVTLLKVAGKDKDYAPIGCDLNGDGKADNGFGLLGYVANSALATLFAKQQVALVLCPVQAKDGVASELWQLDVAAPATAGALPPILPTTWDVFAPTAGPCPPQYRIAPATLGPDTWTAGGPASRLTFPLPLMELTLWVKASQVQVSATVDATGHLQGGLVCGAMSEQQIDKQIALLPPEHQSVRPAIKALLKPDVDTNGDKKKDAVSLALQFEATPVTYPEVLP